MAKIIAGIPEQQWIFAGRFTCRHCGTIFMPERGDPGLKIRDENREFDIHCPVCEGDNRYRRGPDVALGVTKDDPVVPSHQSLLPGSLTGL